MGGYKRASRQLLLATRESFAGGRADVRRGDDVVRVVIGDGALRAEYEKTARDLQVNASFLRSVPNDLLHDHYQRCGIFVLPSTK